MQFLPNVVNWWYRDVRMHWFFCEWRGLIIGETTGRGGRTLWLSVCTISLCSVSKWSRSWGGRLILKSNFLQFQNILSSPPPLDESNACGARANCLNAGDNDVTYWVSELSECLGSEMGNLFAPSRSIAFSSLLTDDRPTINNIPASSYKPPM